MKVLLILWPVIAFFALLPVLMINGMIVEKLFTYSQRDIVNACLIPAGHLLVYLLIGLIVLRKFKKITTKSIKLVLAILASGIVTVGAQLFARSFGEGIRSIDCANNCAGTLYFSPGLPVETFATWIALFLALMFISAYTYVIYKRSDK